MKKTLVSVLGLILFLPLALFSFTSKVYATPDMCTDYTIVDDSTIEMPSSSFSIDSSIHFEWYKDDKTDNTAGGTEYPKSDDGNWNIHQSGSNAVFHFDSSWFWNNNYGYMYTNGCLYPVKGAPEFVYNTPTPTPSPTPTNTPTPTPVPTYTISGTVFNDTNANGTQDTGETGHQDVTVTLSGAGSASTTTDSSGAYTFSNRTAGNYTVTLTEPTGYTATTTNPRTNVVVGPSTEVNFGIALAPTNTPTPTPTSTPTPTPTPTPIFSDTFDSPPNSTLWGHNHVWGSTGGNPSVQDGVLYFPMNTSGTLTSYVYSDQCASYDVQVPITSDGTIFINLRTSSNGQSYYSAAISNYDHTFTISKTISGSSSTLQTTSYNMPTTGGWRNFKFCAIGTQLTAYLDYPTTTLVAHPASRW